MQFNQLRHVTCTLSCRLVSLKSLPVVYPALETCGTVCVRGGFNSHTPEAFDPMEDALDGGFGADSLRRRLAGDGSGFESAFDDDFEPMRYCINCTGALDGDLCMVRMPAVRFCREIGNTGRIAFELCAQTCSSSHALLQVADIAP